MIFSESDDLLILPSSKLNVAQVCSSDCVTAPKWVIEDALIVEVKAFGG